jgi:hypothetical protein
VAFTYGSTSLGTGTLSDGTTSLDLSTAGIPAGTYPITATFSGNGDYLSSSATTNIVVLGYATATKLSASASQLTQGQSGALSATVTRTAESGTPTGTVTFQVGTTSLGSAKLVNGKATFTEATNGNVPPGTYPITATYTGDSSDQASTSSATDVTVIAATATTLALSKNPVPADSSVVLTAKVKETYDSGVPTGTVTFTVGGNSLGSATLTSGTATVNASDFGYPTGTYPLTATYSGDANNAASSTTVNVTVQ